jgi:hypothetical protein
LSEHSAETKHSIDFDRIEVINNIQTYCPLIVREATKITKHPIALNMELDMY